MVSGAVRAAVEIMAGNSSHHTTDASALRRSRACACHFHREMFYQRRIAQQAVTFCHDGCNSADEYASSPDAGRRGGAECSACSRPSAAVACAGSQVVFATASAPCAPPPSIAAVCATSRRDMRHHHVMPTSQDIPAQAEGVIHKMAIRRRHSTYRYRSSGTSPHHP